jgi:hypothetical protein
MMRALLIIALMTLPLAASAAAKRKPVRKTLAPSSSSSSSSSPYDDTTEEAAPSTAAAAATPDAGARPAPPPPPQAQAPETKEAPPPPPSAPAPAPPSADLKKLRADYDRLRDELYKARARAQIVQEGLYPSKLGATLRWKGAPDYVIRRAELRLDGASVWDSGDKPVTDELIKLAERSIKPGTHALTLRLEIRLGTKKGKAPQDADQLGYLSEHTFAILVPEGKRTTVAITGDEDGDPPEYEPEIEVEIESEK